MAMVSCAARLHAGCEVEMFHSCSEQLVCANNRASDASNAGCASYLLCGLKSLHLKWCAWCNPSWGSVVCSRRFYMWLCSQNFLMIVNWLCFPCWNTSHNKLKSIPEELLQLSHLKSLLLQHNELSHLPDGFGQLVSLEELVNCNFLKNTDLFRNISLSMFHC